MARSNSVIRRYTPPTCTLEVLAQSSPLSRWMGKSVIKQVRFNLRFDDPRQPEEEKVVVQGDRDQLEALYTAVSGYVQSILQQSPENFWASRIEAETASKNSVPTPVEDVPHLERDISNSKNRFAKNGDIYLEPSSHLTHQLFLGSLGTKDCCSSIGLSLLQLFDLATALDEYMADVVALPTETQRRGSGNSFAIPAWAPVAAVLVLGLGLMPLTYQYANRVRQQKQRSESVATANKENGTDVSQSPLLTPLPMPTSLLTPSPNASPLPTLGKSLTVPNALSPNSLTSVNPNLSATPKPGSTFPQVSTNPNSSLSSIPPLPPLGSSTPIKPQTGGQTLSLSPNSSSTKTQGGNSSPSITKSKTNLPNTSLPSGTSLGPLTNPYTPKIPVLPSTRALPSPQTEKNQGNSPTNSSKSTSDLLAQLRRSRANSAVNNDKKSTLTKAAANSERILDTNQVAEVKSYLKGRWQPPRGLKAPLEYSLTLGVDGALEQILPLGKAARDYVDKAGIPQIGQPFVSPSRNGQNVKIRAVFKPNGQVQTFPEND